MNTRSNIATYLIVAVLAAWADMQIVRAEPTRQTVTVDPAPLVEQLVKELGAPRFQEREAAEQSLLALGDIAVPAVRRATSSDDPEVRVRALALLDELAYGVTDEWLDEYRRDLDDYPTLEDFEREAFLLDVAMTLGDLAVPFLVRRGIEGDDLEQRGVPEALQHINTQTAGRIGLRALGDAHGETATRIRAWALDRSGRPIDAYLELAKLKVPDDADQELEQVVTKIRDDLSADNLQEAYARARQARETYLESLRLLYLQAEAAERLGRAEEAWGLRDRAQKMHPDVKRPHWLAARMLSEMGHRRLASREWEAVLVVEPVQGPYTVYALLGLARDCAEGGRFTRATELLEQCLKVLIEMRDSRHPMGVLGVEVPRVHLVIGAMRAEAERWENPESTAPVEEPLPDGEFRPTIVASVEPAERLGQFERDASSAQLIVDAEGLPVDWPATGLQPGIQLEPAGNFARLTMHGIPVSPQFDLNVDQRPVTVMLRAGAAVHFLQASHESQTAKAGESYALGLTLRASAGQVLSSYRDVSVTVGLKEYEWEQIEEGIAIESVPDVLEFTVFGTAPSGRRNTTRFTFRTADLLLFPEEAL